MERKEGQETRTSWKLKRVDGNRLKTVVKVVIEPKQQVGLVEAKIPAKKAG